MSYEGLLIDTCNLGTAVSSQNSLGEWKYTWSYSSTDTKCRCAPIRGEERKELPGEFADVQYRMFVLYDTSVLAGDQLQYNSKEYIVRSLVEDSSHHHKTALIAELS